MVRHIILIFVFSFLFSACRQTSNQDTKDETVNQTSQADESSEEEGPPFKDECLCKFDDLGKKDTENKTYNVYISGKGWNPAFTSCSWTWGEMINNISPDDTTIINVKVHLLDLDKFELPKDNSDYSNDSITKHVIAIYKRNTKTGEETCIFDPYKTGKYPRPKQWTEK
jgi:hypothetical protein